MPFTNVGPTTNINELLLGANRVQKFALIEASSEVDTTGTFLLFSVLESVLQ